MSPFIKARHVILAFVAMAVLMVLVSPAVTRGGTGAPAQMTIDLSR